MVCFHRVRILNQVVVDTKKLTKVSHTGCGAAKLITES